MSDLAVFSAHQAAVRIVHGLVIQYQLTVEGPMPVRCTSSSTRRCLSEPGPIANYSLVNGFECRRAGLCAGA
ncbi:hypothetical protein ACFQS2_04535 [Brachybacterium sp. GCM10030267]|uniref:hypothetical protein n=1 Tax=Brachybacterium sp. GCM10030267 TaxID=3273381 RepID=UPI0036100C75